MWRMLFVTTPVLISAVSITESTAVSIESLIRYCAMPQFRIVSVSTKRLYVCVLQEKGTCRSVGYALTWTATLDDSNHPSATSPSTDSILNATCRKSLGALGAWGHCISLMPLSWITGLNDALQVIDFSQAATLKPHCKSFLRLVYPCCPYLAGIACRLAGSTQVSSNSCELRSKTFPCKPLAHSWVSTWRGLHASDWEIKCLTDFQKPLCLKPWVLVQTIGI